MESVIHGSPIFCFLDVLYYRSSNHLLCVVSAFLCTIFDLDIVEVIGSSPTNPTKQKPSVYQTVFL